MPSHEVRSRHPEHLLVGGIVNPPGEGLQEGAAAQCELVAVAPLAGAVAGVKVHGNVFDPQDVDVGGKLPVDRIHEMRRRHGSVGPEVGHLPLRVDAGVGAPRSIQGHPLTGHVPQGPGQDPGHRLFLGLNLPPAEPAPVVLHREAQVPNPPLGRLRPGKAARSGHRFGGSRRRGWTAPPGRAGGGGGSAAAGTGAGPSPLLAGSWLGAEAVASWSLPFFQHRPR